MSEILRWIIWSYFEIFTLIGLKGLRGINSKNGVSSIVSVIFYYGIIIGMIRETLWTYKWVNPLIGLRGLRGINSKNGVSSIVSVIFYYGIIVGMIRETLWTYKQSCHWNFHRQDKMSCLRRLRQDIGMFGSTYLGKTLSGGRTKCPASAFRGRFVLPRRHCPASQWQDWCSVLDCKTNFQNI